MATKTVMLTFHELITDRDGEVNVRKKWQDLTKGRAASVSVKKNGVEYVLGKLVVERPHSLPIVNEDGFRYLPFELKMDDDPDEPVIQNSQVYLLEDGTLFLDVRYYANADFDEHGHFMGEEIADMSIEIEDIEDAFYITRRCLAIPTAAVRDRDSSSRNNYVRPGGLRRTKRKRNRSGRKKGK